MPDPQDIGRWKQGKDVWNAWAQEMLKRKEELQKSGKWKEEDDGSVEYAATKKWFEEASVDFSIHQFQQETNFSSWIFPGAASFNQAYFRGDASFGGAQFNGHARFGKAQFSGDTGFEEAQFCGDFASFDRAQFSGAARFQDAQFSGDFASFDSAQFSGAAVFTRAKFSGNARFDAVQFIGGAEFDAAQFSRGAGFHRAQFSGDATFQEAQFSRAVWFTGALFNGDALFGSAQFSGHTMFDKTQFNGAAQFELVHFSGVVWFGEAQFNGDAKFDYSAMENLGYFRQAQFKADASFLALRSKLSFSLANASFERVPDFVEASFSEPPRLDDLTVQVPAIWKRGYRERVARWRKLKAMAVSGHDHEREMEFFAQETRARRIWLDKLWHAQFWFGVLYELFSNFGRSYLRPVFWWLISFFGFAVFYLYHHVVAFHEKQPVPDLGVWEVLRAAWDDKLDCIIGQSNPVLNALYLSLKNAAVLIGWEKTFKINHVYYCLYGGTKNRQGGLIPDVPFDVAFWSIGQSAISAILIFLFLLAIRNHFRIK